MEEWITSKGANQFTCIDEENHPDYLLSDREWRSRGDKKRSFIFLGFVTIGFIIHTLRPSFWSSRCLLVWKTPRWTLTMVNHLCWDIRNVLRMHTITQINTCIYILTFINPHISKYINLYISTCTLCEPVRTWAYINDSILGACIHTTCIHAYIHTFIHPYIHKCLYTYMHAYMHAYIHDGIDDEVVMRHTKDILQRTSIHTSVYVCMHGMDGYQMARVNCGGNHSPCILLSKRSLRCEPAYTCVRVPQKTNSLTHTSRLCVCVGGRGAVSDGNWENLYTQPVLLPFRSVCVDACGMNAFAMARAAGRS